MKSCFLYKITNNINGKMYIGITFYPEQRWRYHRYNRSKKNISIIQLAIDKYKESNFSFEVICEGSREYIQDLEQKAIALFKTIEHGYNIRAGGEGGAGHSIKKRKDDQCLYVTGFWFPNARSALKKLNLPKQTLYKWLREGSAGEVFHEPQKFYSKLNQPVYVGGFWFRCITVASASLDQKIPNLRSRIYKGFVDQTSGKQKSFNKKSVMVDFIKYESATAAALATHYSKKMIRSRIEKNIPGFARIEET